MFHYSLNDHPTIFNGSSSDGPGFEEMLALAAEQFPMDDGKPMDNGESYAVSVPSPFTSSSGSSSSLSPRCDSDKEGDSDSDSDIEPLCLDNTHTINGQPTRAKSLPTLADDAPFLPHKRTDAIVTPSHLERTNDPLKHSAGMRHAASHPPPTVVRSPPHRLNSSHSISVEDPDHDADGESDGNATDDEYVPSPALCPLKRRRVSPAVITRSTKPSIPHVSPDTSQSRPTKRPRVPPPSRNKQASSLAAIEQAAKNPDFTCPECGWHQTNHRVPDFKRHLLTHTRSGETDTDRGWWCKGVLLRDAARHGIPKTAAQYMFRNEWRVGGCLRTFSRRDALKRHLDNSNVFCVGRPCEAAEEC